MKKIFIVLAITLFTIGASAQEAKSTKKENKEKCSAKKEACTKTMSAEEVAECQAKCKAEGKKCDATTKRKTEKKCCAKK